MKKYSKSLFLCYSSIIAALYVLLTFISSLFGLSSGVIQVRFSEALCIMPIFTSAAIPGLAIGCLISNLITPGAVIFDIIFGSAATLIGSFFTYLLRKKSIIISFLPPVLSNSLIIPMILKYAYGVNFSYIYIFFTVFVGEFISVYIFGGILYKSIFKKMKFIK